MGVVATLDDQRLLLDDVHQAEVERREHVVGAGLGNRPVQPPVLAHEQLGVAEAGLHLAEQLAQASHVLLAAAAQRLVDDGALERVAHDHRVARLDHPAAQRDQPLPQPHRG